MTVNYEELLIIADSIWKRDTVIGMPVPTKISAVQHYFT
jgi:hypothetical protein